MERHVHDCWHQFLDNQGIPFAGQSGFRPIETLAHVSRQPLHILIDKLLDISAIDEESMIGVAFIDLSKAFGPRQPYYSSPYKLASYHCSSMTVNWLFN